MVEVLMRQQDELYVSDTKADLRETLLQYREVARRAGVNQGVLGVALDEVYVAPGLVTSELKDVRAQFDYSGRRRRCRSPSLFLVSGLVTLQPTPPCEDTCWSSSRMR